MPETSVSQTASQSPDKETSPSVEQLELEKRIDQKIRSLIKDTVAGSIGSLTPRLDQLERLLNETVVARRRDDVERMTPQQLKEAAVNATVSTSAGVPASSYFKQLAQELLNEADTDAELPAFEPGKPTSEYEALYRQLRKTVLDKVREKSESAAKSVAGEELRRLLAEKGLDVTDSGSGTSASGRRFTAGDLADMTPEQYAAAGGADAVFTRK